MENKDKIKFSVPIGLNKDTINTVKVPNNDEDYQSMAKMALKIADDFYEFSNPNDIAANVAILANIAVSVNSFFSCELYLKSLLLVEHKKVKTHSLWHIYCELSDELKDAIKNKCENNGAIDIDFDRELQNVKDGFEMLRYAYELKGFCFHQRFIMLLQALLRDIAHSIIGE